LPSYETEGDYKKDEALRILACQHIFHRVCVDQWFETQSKQDHKASCPICRRVINDDTSTTQLANIQSIYQEMQSIPTSSNPPTPTVTIAVRTPRQEHWGVFVDYKFVDNWHL
jgi:hypothetical protein